MPTLINSLDLTAIISPLYFCILNTQWAAALPVVLLQSQYSQSFETESDVDAFEQLVELKIDPVHFGAALILITDDAYKDLPSNIENNINKVYKQHGKEVLIVLCYFCSMQTQKL